MSTQPPSSDSVRQHYDNHLASFYSWMLGGLEERIPSEHKQLAKILGAAQSDIDLSTATFLDLGAGNGLHSFALACCGLKKGRAVDVSEAMLQQLQEDAPRLSPAAEIETVTGDVLDEQCWGKETTYNVIVCMGDTLAHLPSMASLEELFKLAYSHLNDNGILVLSFREQDQTQTQGLTFIPVRSDADRIHTCVLEHRPERLMQVHDVLHKRSTDPETGAVTWGQAVSSYFKIKVNSSGVNMLLNQQAFSVFFSEQGTNGMVYIAAKKQL